MLYELERLCGVSGREEAVRQSLKETLLPLSDAVTEDRLGSLIAQKRGRSGKTLLLAVAMDEPGIVVTKITEDGFLNFDTVGRLRADALVSKRVRINGHTGVIACKAVHLTTKKEREKAVSAQQLFVDLGAENKAEAEALARPGDCGVVESSCAEFGAGMIKGRALGAHMGCAIAARLFQRELPVSLEVTFSAQSEIGYRGLLAAADRRADLGITLEGVSVPYSAEDGVPRCGAGAVLLGANSVCKARFAKEAEENGIPLQSYVASKKGMEGILMQLPGIREQLALGIPVRNMGTAAQVAAKSDMDATERLLLLWMQKLSEEEKRDANQ